MRALWPIERAVLDATGQDYPQFAEALNRQAELARVTDFENTGAGFFSTVVVSPEAPPLQAKSPLDGAYGDVVGIEHGMGFVVFLEGGLLSLIEGYCHGDGPTKDIDFEHVAFNLKPWSASSQ